ncbi:Hypothetical_protein [Hexamita inflata]|uniref:Hypothetical_protein n=1 Tax=Hexamita inflata TaxID=28002 RepID=A0ABP1KAY8_9EUKA
MMLTREARRYTLGTKQTQSKSQRLFCKISKFPFEETLRSIGAFQWSFDLVTFRLGAFTLSASERPQASFCQALFLRYSSQVQLSNLLQSFSSRFQAGLRNCLSFK